MDGVVNPLGPVLLPTGSQTVSAQRSSVMPIAFGYYPQEGSRAVAVQYSWTAQTSYVEDLSQLVARGVETTIQGVYVDNSSVSQFVTLVVNGTGQVLTIAPYAQGIYPLFFTGTPGFTLSIPGSDPGTTRLQLLNVPPQSVGTWAGAPGASSTIGPFLPVAGGTLTGPTTLAAGAPLLVTPTGGTVARSVQDILADVINVKSYGATGNGTTDDTAAIQAAIAAVPASGGVVYAPRGTYLVSASLLLKANTWLRGDGMQVTIFLMAPATNLNPVIGSANLGDSYITLSDFTVDGNKANNGAGGAQGILFTQISRITCRNIEVQNVNGHGMVASGNGANTTIGGYFNRIYIHGCTLFGFVVTYAFRQAVVDGLLCSGNGSPGNPTFHAVYLDASECLISDVFADSNVNNGIHIHNVFGCTYANLIATRNGMHGIYVEVMTKSSGSNWRAQNNSMTTTNTYDDIHFVNTNAVPPGYGITANSVVSGILVGPDPNFGASQERYGLYIEDNVNNNIKLSSILYAAPSSTGNVRLPTAMETLVVDDWQFTPNNSVLWTSTAAATVNSSSLLSMFSTLGVGQRTIPTALMRVGNLIRLRADGYYVTPTAASNVTVAVIWAGTSVITQTIAAPTNATNQYFAIEADITLRALGASGTVVCAGRAYFGTSASAVTIVPFATTSPITVNTTADVTVDLQGSWSAPTTHTITTPQSWIHVSTPGG